MRYLSVCSGIEAATVAWHPLGWEPVAFSEIEKFPSAVLAHHWPGVPNLGDMTKHHEWNPGPIDLLVGGTPCQSFSVAGLRKGLEDPRGNLTLAFLGLVDQFKPTWVVWENVPGVLSDRGNAFGQFLSGLGELGYQFAYRVLDAQYFGVPQRRRRVFVVASAGTVHPAEILLEPESLCRDLTPSREAGEGFADGIAHSLRAGGFDASEDGTGRGTPLIPQVANPLTARMHKGINTTLDEGQTPIAFYSNESRMDNVQTDGVCVPVKVGSGGSSGNPPAIAFSCKDHGGDAGENAPTLRSMGHDGSHANGGGQVAVASAMQVRRLTPRECERLQGFPDDYTRIPWRGKEAEDCPDGPRYKALGNSMAVPVMRWIGERIARVSTR